MNKIFIIIRSEYLAMVNKKSFIILTLLLPVILVGLIAGTLFLSQLKSSDIKVVTVVDNTGLYDNVLKNTDTYLFENLKTVSSSEQVEETGNKDNFATLIIDKNLIENPDAITLFSERTLPVSLKTEITKQFNSYLTNEKIESYDIPDLTRIINESNVNININTIKKDVSGVETSSSSEGVVVVSSILTFLIYIFIFMYGAIVMNSIIKEKSSRIIEIMVSSVKPFQMMMGKIIAITFVGLTQIFIWIIFALIIAIGVGIFKGANVISGTEIINGEMVQVAGYPILNIFDTLFAGINFPKVIIFFIIYFIGGYLLYASMFAAIGSLADQESDTQQLMIPIMMIILFALYAALYSIENPDGPLAFWCSMIPFTSPIVMMVRLPYDVPAWELITSIAVLFLTFLLTLCFAARIYRIGILMYGKKSSMKEVYHWIKYKY